MLQGREMKRSDRVRARAVFVMKGKKRTLLNQ